MRFCLGLGGEELDLEVEAHAEATVADLVTALGGRDGEHSWLEVAGERVPPSTLLQEVGLADGAAVALAGPPAPVLVAASGTASPPLSALNPPPRGIQGRKHGCGTGSAGNETWWRPPRAPLPPEPPPVEAPAEPPLPGEPARLSWPALAAPAAVAVALALLLDPRLAVIALVGPVAQLATWLDDHRRFRRRQRDADAVRVGEADRFARERAAAAALAMTRALAAQPHVGELARWATDRHPRLWERRAVDADFLHLRGLPPPNGEHRPLVVGIEGDRSATLAVARNLVVQTAVLHGPADIGVTIAAGAAESTDWDWAKWLPHLRTTATDAFVVIDVAGPAAQRRALARMAGARLVVVVGHRGVPLPDACHHVVDAHAPTAEGLDAHLARIVARSLAALRDPDAAPAAVTGAPRRLLPLLETLSTETRHGLPRVPLGTTVSGRVFAIDLVADGPHVLIAGTTGSGKSELLRTLVASLAAVAPPEILNFVLVDYKGGSTFDACARLPHTAGVVTDLDGELGTRMLRCLDAELRHRERTLRQTGSADIDSHNTRGAAGSEGVLPRLVVVIDEFAALAADVPAFLAVLAGIAQRGRSLGVHLVLATQRPAGVVNDAIRANIGLRIALRVNDANESLDVVGTRDAASIPRDRPGRAIAHLDAGRVVAFDTAMVSAEHAPAGPRVTVRPFVLNPPAAESRSTASHPSGPTDLDVLAERLASTARARGAPPPRRPWPEPLPAVVDLASIEAPDNTIPLGLADDPDHQARHLYSWGGGNLLACGTDGSGAAETLVALACALARVTSPDDLHIYAVDNHCSALAPVHALPHTGAVIEASDTDRQLRLLRALRQRVDNGARPAGSRPQPMILFLVADLGGLVARFDQDGLLEASDHLGRTVADGPAAGLTAAMAARRPGAVPHALAASFTTRLVFRLADPQDATLFGVRPLGAQVPAGRAVDAVTGLDVQIAAVAPSTLTAVSGAWPAAANPPPPIRTLPNDLSFEDIVGAPSPATGLWLPVGLSDDDLEPCGLLLASGDHALIAGGPRAGKTTLLATITTAARAAGVTVARSIEEARGTDGTCVFLIDDAERVDDADGALSALLAERRPALHLIAAGRTDALRAAYGHWTRDLRHTATGVLLVPRPDDGDLFGVVLPRSQQPDPAGRGYLIANGVAHRFHAAH